MMQRRNVWRRASLLVVGAALAACSASNEAKRAESSEVSPTLLAASAPAAKDPHVAEWRKAIAKVPSPTEGCFHASYPSTTWTEVPCGQAPVDSVPSHGPPVPSSAPDGADVEAKGSPFRRVWGGGDFGVGNGADYFAQTPSNIYEATGSFPSVSNLTGSSPSNYSLQVNSNQFRIPASNSICPNCLGWEQAIYSISQGTFIEYWLLNQSSCPTKWTPQNGGCFQNTTPVPGVPSEPITDLGNMSLELLVGSTNDSLVMTIGTQAYHGSWASVLGLSQSTWNLTEFGVFGDSGNSNVTLNGSTGSNPTIVGQIEVAEPASATCTTSNFEASTGGGTSTGETNNLNQICCLANGAGPDTITFMESTNASQPCTLCGAEGQSCCTFGGAGGKVASSCASPSDVCYQGTCEHCGGNGEPCCAGATPCTAAGSTCSSSTGGFCVNPVFPDCSVNGEWTCTGTYGTETEAYFQCNAPPPNWTLTLQRDDTSQGWIYVGGCPGHCTVSVDPVTEQYSISEPDPNTPVPGTAFYRVCLNGYGQVNCNQTVSLTTYACTCTPTTCAASGTHCGSVSNGCDGTLNCGTCAVGTCSAGQCVTGSGGGHCKPGQCN